MAMASIGLLACHRPEESSPVPRARSVHGAEAYWAASEIVLEPVAPLQATNVDAHTLMDALEREVSEWNGALDGCMGAPRLVVGALRAGGAARDDGHNVVVLVGTSWCPADRRGVESCYDPEAEAITHVRTRDDLAGPRGGEIREGDIEINAVGFRWSADGEPADTRSLRAILGHELGHLLGLDHACRLGPGGRRDAVALPCTIERRASSIMYPDPTESGRPAVVAPDRDAISTLCARRDTLAASLPSRDTGDAAEPNETL
jgi:hypothetical protein